jgi:hypothetical protein
MGFKIFRTGAAIYRAVVVARSTGPNRPNCEFRVLVPRFAATVWKRTKTSPRTLARTYLVVSPWQRPVSHFRPHPAVSGEKQMAASPTHRTPLIWHPVTSFYFPKWNWSWKEDGLIPPRKSRPNRRKCLTLWQKRTSRNRSKNEGNGGTRVYMREGTTSRVMATDRSYGEFYDFYSVSPEYFGYTLDILLKYLNVV